MMQPAKFDGKVVIITGASSGIGRSTAEYFGQHGASVVITGRNAEKLQETKDLVVKAGGKSEKVLVVVGDVMQGDVRTHLVDETIKQFGRIDVLVNNAGAGSSDGTAGCPIEASLDLYDYVMDLNARSVVALTQLAIPHLKKTKGTIVNISSIGSFRPVPQFIYYGMAKSAIDQFTRNLAVQLGPDGIRVNAVNPGLIQTNFGSRLGIPQAMIEAYEKGVADSTPLQRAGKPEEIAKTIAFLATEDASYITGQLIVVDGGTSIYSARNTKAAAADK